MLRRKAIIYALCACLLGLAGLALTACGPKKKANDTSARDAEFAKVQEMHDELVQKRRQLAALTAPAEQGEAAPAGEATAPGGGDAAALQKEVEQLTQDFTDKLVAFINAYPPVVGEPPPPPVAAAIRMKSDEDLLLARDWSEKGGDYRRAMDIYEAALKVDPDYAALKDALAKAQEMRFITEDRFGKVKKGMTEAQVREALGQVNLRNERHFDKDNVTAWYYPKDDQGAAAAVWFRPDKKKGLVVYQTQFNAIKGNEAAAQ
jgi:tetratricopeptide (TPR) repeat protein